MKLPVKHLRQMIKRTLAGVLSSALLVTSLPASTFAEEASAAASSEYDAILKVLAEEDPEIARQYPAGLFKFDTLLAEMDENAEESLKLYLVRHGGTEGEATVNVKFSDYSARYGQDYTARLEGAEEDIAANPESKPLLYLLGSGDAEENLRKAYGSYDAMVETLGQEKVDRMEDLVRQYSQDKAETDEAGQEQTSVSEESPLYQLNEQVSQYAQGGVDTEQVWQTQQSMDAATAKLSWGMMEEVFPGTEVDVTFADGEQIKEIIVNPIDNDTSDGERIFSVILNDITNEQSGIDSDNTVSVTLHDDEASALSKISVDTTSLPEWIAPGSGTFTVTLKREEALYNTATANFFAVTDNNVVLQSGKVIFMPGMDEQKVEIDTAKSAGATSLSLYFDAESAIGCEVAGGGSIPVHNGEPGVQALEETSGIVYTAQNSPIGFAGEGTYSGFNIFPSDENFVKGSDTAGPQHSSTRNAYNTNEKYWDLYIPDCNCGYKNQRNYMQSKWSFPTFNFVQSMAIDCVFADQEPSDCNRVLFSTNNNYNISYTNQGDIDDMGGVWCFSGDYDNGGKPLTLSNDGTGGVSGADYTLESNKNKIGTMGTRWGVKNESGSGGKLKFAVWKTSSGVNGPYIKLYGIRVNYKQFKFRVEVPDDGKLDNKSPGILHILSRDGSSNSQEDTRYALEKLSFAEVAANDNYKLKGMQLKDQNGNWRNISSKYFNAEQMSLTLNASFYSDYASAFSDNAPNGSTIVLRPVYEGCPITVTINTDEHGGLMFDGKYYKANSGSHQVATNAGKTVTFSPYDVKQGWHFSSYDGNKSNIHVDNDTRQIEYQQNQEKQTLELGLYNYVITPMFTESGTNVKINVKGSIPYGCKAPEVTEFSLDQGNLKGAGEFLQFNATVGSGLRAVWKVKTRDHTWQNRTFYGETFDYGVINGDNEIELSFEVMEYVYYEAHGSGFWSETRYYAPSYTAISGQVLGYQGTILNPPQSDGRGGYRGEAKPIANAVVSMGKYTARTDKDGNFRLYSYEEDTYGNGVNQQHFLQAYDNEDHTIRVTCNNMTQIYVINTGKYPKVEKSATTKPIHSVEKPKTKTWTQPGWSSDSSKPYECSLSKGITTTFYGNGPVPTDFYVLTGTDDSHAPSQKNHVASMPMSNTTIGFRLEMDHISEETPLSRVDLKIYDKDGTLREGCTYPVTPQYYNYNNGKKATFILDRYYLYEDGVQTGYMYFNGLLNFHDGDRIFVELIRTEYDAEGNPIDFSYGEYDTGVEFYEVPGQGLETSMPSVETLAGVVPDLPIIGSISPGFNAGPLSVKSTITRDTMEFSVGFNVATFTKVANAKQLAEKAKARTTPEEAAQLDELEDSMEDGEIEPEEYVEYINQLYGAEEEPQDPMQPATGVQEEPQQMQAPTAKQMKDPSKFARSQFGESFLKNAEEFNNIINKIKAGDKTSAALKDATTKSNGAIPVAINVTVGVTVRMVADDEVMHQWVFDAATIYAQFSLTVAATFYMDLPAVPIPIYVGFSFTVSLGLYNTIKAHYMVTLSQMTGTEGDYDPDVDLGYSGNVPLTLAIEGFVGVGVRKLLSLEIGLGFVQQLSFGFGDGAVGVGMTTFYGYIEMSLVIFNAKWKFAQESWSYMMYNSNAPQAQIMSVMDGTVGEAMNAELSSLTLDQEQYASNFVGGRQLRSSIQQDHTDTILTDAPNIESQIIPLGDGKALMVYEGVDNSRTQYNRNAVYYTIYNGSFWSEPQVLQNDGTLDMGLMIEDMGDNFVISWSSAEKTYQENDFTDGTHTDEDGNKTVNSDALLELLSSMDVYAIVLDKSEVTDEALQNAIRRITKDNPLEEQSTWGFAHENPNAVELEDGRIMLFYTSSDYNSYGDDTPISSLNELLSAPGMMMYRIYENGEWSEEYYSTETAYQGEAMKEQWYGQRLADINLKDTEGNIYYPITGYADVTTVMRGGEEKVLITYVVDTDGNISTSTDRIVCMSVMTPPSEQADSTTSLPIQLSNTGIPVSNTKFQTAFSDFGEITLVTFTQGDNLVYLDLTKLFNGITLSEEEREELDPSFTDEDTVGIVESTLTVNGKEIPYYSLKEGVAPAIAVKGDNNNSLSNGFASASGEDGNVYLAWPDSNGEEQHIMVSALNVEAANNGSYELKWSSPKKMSLKNADEETNPDAEGYEREYAMNPSIAVDTQGNMMIIHNRFDLELDTGTDENGNEVAVGKHRVNNRLCVAFTKAVGSLEWTDSESGDLAVSAEAITLSEEYPLAETTFTATAQICNKGLLAAKEINVDANLITLDKDGNEIAATPAKQLLKPDSLEIRVNGAITAEFEMTQEMVDHAVNDGYQYKVVMDVCEGSFVDQMITAQAEVKVGSRLEIEANNIHGFRTRKVILGDDKKAAIDDLFDGNNRYMISATIHNTGNVDSAAPEISLEMENKNAFVTDGYDNKEMDTDERLEYLEKVPFNASLTNNENYKPYVPISGTIAEEITSIGAGQSAAVTVISKKIPDSYYSDRGASTFLLGITDANSYDPENEIPHYVSFTQTVGDFDEPRIKENQEVVYEVSMEAGTAKNLTLGSVKKDSVIKEPVEWSSNNESVVTVDGNGTITAAGNGVAVVTAKTGNYEAKLRVTVSGASEEPEEPEEPSGSETPGTEEPSGSEEPGTSELPSGNGDGSGQNPPDADVPAGVTKNDGKNIKTGVSTRNVRTGDPADLRIWFALLWASGGAICAGVYRRKKKARKSNKG